LKLQEFRALLEATVNLFGQSGRTASVGAIHRLAGTLKTSELKTTNDLLKIVAKLSISQNASEPKIIDIIPLLSGVGDFVKVVGKKPVSDDVAGFILELKKCSGVTLTDLVTAIEGASVHPPGGRRAGAADEAGGAEYLLRLKDALGKDAEFKAIYAELKNNKRMTKPALVALANEFMGPVSSKATKAQALDRIWSRHKKVVDFRDEN
jgi:hypothetical protein